MTTNPMNPSGSGVSWGSGTPRDPEAHAEALDAAPEPHIVPIGLSSSSVAPAKVVPCFEAAARLGYDGVEIMVWRDPDSQDPTRLQRRIDEFGLPVLSLHAPTLLVSKGVMGSDLWARIDRTMDMAAEVGCPVVVAHPPFRWQGSYAAGFEEGVLERSGRDGVVLAVENMFPWYMLTSKGHRSLEVYHGGWDPVPHTYPHVILDVSHAGTSRQNVYEMAKALGPRLAHIHLTDSKGSFKDEHLVPGDGAQHVVPLLEYLRDTNFRGSIAVEVNTRGRNPAKRDEMLRRSLEFARTHLDPTRRRPRAGRQDGVRPRHPKLPQGAGN